MQIGKISNQSLDIQAMQQINKTQQVQKIASDTNDRTNEMQNAEKQIMKDIGIGQNIDYSA